MKWIKNKYEFDYCDITTALCVVAVMLTVVGYGIIGTIIFIVNCLISIVLVITISKRINLLILQLSLLILNIYFLF